MSGEGKRLEISLEDGESTWSPDAGGTYQLTTKCTQPDGSVVGLRDGGSISIKVRVKLTPPTFVAKARLPNRYHPDSGAMVDDLAWRRDEIAQVDVSSTDHDVDPSSIKVSVTGIQGTNADAGAPLPPSAVLSPESCTDPDGGYCGLLNVDLAVPPMRAYQGVMSLRVTGQDTCGNQGSGSGLIPVTRLKWAYQAPSVVREVTATPAIGSAGRIYVSMIRKFIALNPNGDFAWENVPPNDVQASAIVGPGTAGHEKVFYVTSGSSGEKFVAEGFDGSVQKLCSGEAGGQIDGTPTLLDPDAGSVALVVDTTLLASTPTGLCHKYTVEPVAVSGGLISNGDAVFYADQTNRIYNFFYEARTRNWLPGWNVAIDAGVSLAATPSSVIVAARGLYALSAADGGIQWVPRTPDIGASNPMVDRNGRIVATVDKNGMRQLVAYAPPDSGVSPETTPIAFTTDLAGVPALGEGDLVHVAERGGAFHVFRAGNLSEEWSESIFDGFRSPIALDCSRDDSGKSTTRPGVLYVGGIRGKLYAFIVDSRGIDVKAGWPKFQHDPRNTGNAQVNLSEFDCLRIP